MLLLFQMRGNCICNNKNDDDDDYNNNNNNNNNNNSQVVGEGSVVTLQGLVIRMYTFSTHAKNLTPPINTND